MNFKLPLTERRAHVTPSHQGRYNFSRPDSQRKWYWEENLVEKKKFAFSCPDPSATSMELFLYYYSLFLFMIVIFLEMYFQLLKASIVNKSLAVKPGISGFKLQLMSHMTFSKPLIHMTFFSTAINKRVCVYNNNAHLPELLWGLTKLPLKMPSTRPGL